MSNAHKINKVVLAYSGGLDTSIIIEWLKDNYDCEVVTFTADIGQGEEVEPARAKAIASGVKEIYIEDLKEEFVRDFVFPMFRANTIFLDIFDAFHFFISIFAARNSNKDEKYQKDEMDDNLLHSILFFCKHT